MVTVRALDRKLLRDLAHIWAQALAVALVMACGVATIVIAVGAYRSLDATRSAFYERYRFGAVFASAVRAPRHLYSQFVNMPGVFGVELRIVKPFILDMPGMQEPGSGLAISLPDHRTAHVNRLYLKSGRLPSPASVSETVVNESFATAHGLRQGDRFSVVMNGHRQSLSVTGVVHSPEFIYAIGPGDMVPDDRRFAIIFMPQRVMAGLFDMEGAFNNLAIALRKDASLEETIARTDFILKPYGGIGAYGRDDQFSHAFLNSELDQLRAMAAVIPPIFLVVAAFLVNMILSRLVALEREQIGLLKAVGYGSLDIAAHYGKMVVMIAIVGLIIGSLFGFWLGRGLTQLYAQFFSFPFLIFSPSPDLYFIAGGVTVAAGLLGAVKAVLGVVLLPPAVAMQPPAPADYTSVFARWMRQTRVMSQLTTMALRHLLHRPARALLTTFGTAMPVALLITSLFTYDSIDSMINTIFFQAERQHATLIFADEASPRALHGVTALPGILRSEPFRATEVIIRKAHRSVRTEVLGVPAKAELSRILDIEGNPVSPPSEGVMLSERVAEKLAVRPGDEVSLVLLRWGRREITVPVTGLTHTLVGLAVFTRLERLNTMIGEGPRISGVRVGLDSNRLDDIYKAVKQTPAIASIALSNLSREKFRETVERNISISTQVYVGLAIVITFGVIYNSARIQLSERARELASLRVFGFTRGEVSRVLMSELAIIVLLAQPIGWLVGYGFAWSVVQGFETDIFRIPLVIERSTYTTSSLIVIGAALASALLVRRRINRLDLIRVLKTRE